MELKVEGARHSALKTLSLHSYIAFKLQKFTAFFAGLTLTVKVFTHEIRRGAAPLSKIIRQACPQFVAQPCHTKFWFSLH